MAAFTAIVASLAAAATGVSIISGRQAAKKQQAAAEARQAETARQAEITRQTSLVKTPGQQIPGQGVEPTQSKRRVSGGRSARTSQTVFTSQLGLSEAARSGATTKTLTGQ